MRRRGYSRKKARNRVPSICSIAIEDFVFLATGEKRLFKNSSDEKPPFFRYGEPRQEAQEAW